MEAMGIIFSNIYDSKMGDLTWERTSGSIPFGGRYRQIDFVLSNMSNSGIRNIGIITKYNYQSLMDHLANCEDWDLHLGENVRFLPPYATGHTGAYRGKLEALQTALPVLERSDTEYVILSDTTVLCAIDFSKVVDAHVASGCDLTVVAKAGKADGKHTQTLAVKVDENGKVVDLAVDYCAESRVSNRFLFCSDTRPKLSIMPSAVTSCTMRPASCAQPVCQARLLRLRRVFSSAACWRIWSSSNSSFSRSFSHAVSSG